jgi:hypothetical protein
VIRIAISQAAFDAIKALTFVGSLSGLASVGFLVYDRLIRFRPSVFLIPKDFSAQIRISNVANETIIVDEITITPAFLQLVRANDLITSNEEKQVTFYGKAARKLPDGAFLVIKPLDQRTVPLHRLAEFESADETKLVKIRCRWRNTRQSVWWPRYVRVKTTAKDIRDLIESTMTNKVT